LKSTPESFVALDLPDYEPAFAMAIEQFWQDRAGQMARQRLKGLTDAGTRGSVTGGTHLHAVRDVIRQVVLDAGLTHADSNRLPGFYRAAKTWDTVVMHEGAVLAIIELKSQVGSFGNNVNNRIEEMIGQSADIWKATRERLLGPIRPWFGYVMILEADEKSTRPQALKNTMLPVDRVFDRASYVDQYGIALDRLRLEGDMNAVCLATTNRHEDNPVNYPNPTMTFAHFARSLRLRLRLEETTDAL
jgi:Restriction endonuclease XhoI